MPRAARLVTFDAMDATKKIRNHSVTGADGGVYVFGTTPVEGNFYAIQIVADNSSVTVEGNVENATALGLVTLPTGFILYGRFNKVTLGGGAHSAILYKV